jgi:hypothetical protein
MPDEPSFTDDEIRRLGEVRDWSAFLALPWRLQDEFKRRFPQIPAALERRHFAQIEGKV